MDLDFAACFKPRQVPDGGFPRQPVILGNCMVATSHPLATRVAVKILDAGGNAIDAAIAAAALLTVAEPSECGPGGDGFAQVWFGDQLYGINGSGRSPADPSLGPPTMYGPRSVTVPGLVAMWADLSARFGRLGLDSCLEPAVRAAENGVPISNRIAELWSIAAREGRAPFQAPLVGERYRLPDLGHSLRAIADRGAAGFYEGEIAESIASESWVSTQDLHAHRSEWVEPVRFSMGGIEVCELPPNSQGIAALEALAIWRGLQPADDKDTHLHLLVETTKVALADASMHIGDLASHQTLLDDAYITSRRSTIRPDRTFDCESVPDGGGDTTYLCVLDSDGNAISLIQSLFHRFGSGVTPAGSGVTLQNRAAGFSPDDRGPNAYGPGKRPYHTLMPGMLVREGTLLGPFGIMGGAVQAQAHLRVLTRLLDDGADPQAALDAARFRVQPNGAVLLEPGLWPFGEALERRGHTVVRYKEPAPFGVGQMILRYGDALVGGSDGRGDGVIGGF